MRIQCDTLKYATLLKKKGLKSNDADGFMSTLTEIEINNIHSLHEVNSMLSESVKEVFIEQDKKLAEQRRENDLKIAEQRRKFDARMKDSAKYNESQLREQRNTAKEERNTAKEERNQYRKESIEQRKAFHDELVASRRWTIGTILTVGLSLAAYLSALIHFNH